MLRSFRLGNHRSFADEQELLLMPSGPRGKDEVVPVTAIYGANASGKSNLLDGLQYMQRAVTDSFGRWDPDRGMERKPFRLSGDGPTTPSTFVLEAIIDGVPYTYGFSIDDNEVLEEWLYSYPEKRRRKLFERERGEIEFSTTIKGIKSKLELVEDLTRPNALFLSAIAQMRLDPLVKVSNWMRRSLSFARSAATADVEERILSHIERNPQSKERFVSLLQAADVGINDYVFVDDESTSTEYGDIAKHIARMVDEADFKPSDKEHFAYIVWPRGAPPEGFPSSYLAWGRRPRLLLIHGSDTQFELADESAGTNAWLALLPGILDALDEGRVFVVDEIDTSLHPLLTAQLVRLFQDKETNANGAQLIFTTHDSSLLGTMLDHEVLTRDQVWFAEKGTDGASQLYPLTDFKPRKEHNLERRYLGGSYGAIPILEPQDFTDAIRA